MFVLTEFKDTVRIPPKYFNTKLNEAIADELNRKLANKVVPSVGLCIGLYRITELQDSYIFPGDGASHTKVQFKYVVFRPFIEEVIIGKIKSCSHEGVQVTLGFFDDILIPQNALQHPSRFDEAEHIWIWEYESEESTHQMFMDLGEEIRFRVVDEIFVDMTPAGPKPIEVLECVEEKKVPYTLIGSCSESGLGLLSWWVN